MRKTLRMTSALIFIMISCISAFGMADAASILPPGNRPVKTGGNIIFIIIDSLRPDYLGCYGHADNISPNIDMIASESTLFERAYTVAPWTNPTLVSLFTGLYPQAVMPPNKWKNAYKVALPNSILTLAERLKKVGYFSTAFNDSKAMLFELQFHQGFNEFISRTDNKTKKATDVRTVTDNLDGWLSVHRDQKFFLFLHLVYTHQPYRIMSNDKTVLFRSRFFDWSPDIEALVREAYSDEVKNADAVIGALYSSLREKGLLDTTTIIFTADHGEGLWEHGFSEHGNSLYNELLRIPLIIRPAGYPGLPAKRITSIVSNVDLFPTVLDLANINPPRNLHGRSLLGYLTGGVLWGGQRIVFSESPHTGPIYGIACQNDRWKFIYAPHLPRKKFLSYASDILSGKDCSFFDIQKDPGEHVNLISRAPFSRFLFGIRVIFHKVGNDMRRSRLERIVITIDAQAEERLRSLGYAN